MRDSFVFYRSFYEAIRELPRDIQGEIYTAIMEYGLYGNETDNLKPIARSIFMLVKPLMDANYSRYENGCKGGRPKGGKNQAETEPKPKQNQTETKPKPNDNVYVNVNDNMIDDDVVETREEGKNVGDNNDRFLAAFFGEANAANIGVMCKQMHVTPDRLRTMAGEVLAEWELTGRHYGDYTPWARHLINHIRKKTSQDGKQQETSRTAAKGGPGGVRGEPAPAAAKPLRSTI